MAHNSACETTKVVEPVVRDGVDDVPVNGPVGVDRNLPKSHGSLKVASQFGGEKAHVMEPVECLRIVSGARCSLSEMR